MGGEASMLWATVDDRNGVGRTRSERVAAAIIADTSEDANRHTVCLEAAARRQYNHHDPGVLCSALTSMVLAFTRSPVQAND
jgi:hypothetical protein